MTPRDPHGIAAVHESSQGEAVADLLVDSRCALGEGIVWCDRRQVAWWTDIESSRLWRYRWVDGNARSWRAPGRVACLALCESGRLLLGMSTGLYSLEVDDIEHADALQPEKLADVPVAAPGVRVNDGRADRSGNFVFGTMDEGPDKRRLGRFHQYSRRHGLRPLALEAVAIANSVCFGLEGDRMYYCDSLQRRIMACGYDAQAGSVGRPEVFAVIEPPAEPDGAAIDREGRLWCAHWAAGRIACHGHDGRIESIVEVPVSNPSCLAFGGPSLDTILITSARIGLNADRLRAEPGAGGLYAANRAGAVGLPEARFDDR